MEPPSGRYFHIEIQGGQYKAESGDQKKQSALDALRRIKLVLEESLHQKDGTTLSKTDLLHRAKHIKDAYMDKAYRGGFFARLFGMGKEKEIQETYQNIEKLVEELAPLELAQAEGYQGSDKVEARDHLQMKKEIFRALHTLSEKHYLPGSYKGAWPFRTFDPEATLEKNKGLAPGEKEAYIKGLNKALRHYAGKGDLVIVHVLMQLGAEVNSTNPNESPLRQAIKHDHPQVVKALLEKGANAEGELTRLELESEDYPRPEIHQLLNNWEQKRNLG